MLGYWNDPEASAAALKAGGWLAMGDLARLRDGLLYLDARARDLILVSAENVSPTEVEYRLEEHPAVLEAAVLAVDDPVTGDAVCAVVVVGPDAPVGVEELAEGIERLAEGDQPRVLRLVSYLPPSRMVWTNEEAGEAGQVTTVTFEAHGDRTRVVVHDRYPSKAALDEAIATGGTTCSRETFSQLDAELSSLIGD